MNVTFRFCFRSPLKSLKLPVFKGLSTDLGSHSFLHISFYPLYIESIDEYYPSVKTTGIEETLADGNSSHSAIARVEYFSLNGTKLATSTKGVNIRKTTLANGKIITDKVIK